MSADQRIDFKKLQAKFGVAPENEHWELRPRLESQWLVHLKTNGEAVAECFVRDNGDIVCIYRGIEGPVASTPLQAVNNALIEYELSKGNG